MEVVIVQERTMVCMAREFYQKDRDAQAYCNKFAAKPLVLI